MGASHAPGRCRETSGATVRCLAQWIRPFTSQPGDVKTASVVKANDSEEGECVAFTLESITIGPETTAPVVVPADAAQARPSSAKRKLSPRSRRALEALNEAIINHGQAAPIDLQLPASTKTVTLDQWREELFTQNVLDRASTNPRMDFTASINWQTRA